jgi:pimeloyl-ACP methyl ester carboxylesterase
LVWRTVKADSANRFAIRRWENIARGNTFGNPNRVDRGTGYLYLNYTASKATTALLNIKGNSGVYVNGVPHMGDPYSAGYMYIPVKLKKGLNEFYIRGTNVVADLIFPAKTISLLTEDLTLPMIVQGRDNSRLSAALVVLNASDKPVQGLQVKTTMAGKILTTTLPSIPAMTTRKIAFDLDGSAIQTKGHFPLALALMAGEKKLDTTTIRIESVLPSEQYTRTFTSNIDGSLQYYAVTPQWPAATAPNQALFLSVHGAGVEAIGQARAYRSKDWGNLVAATNRRPRGFNWEDWGRLDALEVLALGKQQFNPDPNRIYLTGHSMGGHGTWFLGATYPGNWAAIGACAGYPTMKSYGSADGVIPDSSSDPAEQVLLRSSNQSDVPRLVQNYKPLGIYILHGDSDKVVPVRYARQMRDLLGDFHPDFSYYEYPGGEHWFGDQSVDWKPLFDYFKWHKRSEDSAVNDIDFTTASPGISSTYRWAGVLQQQHPLQYSRMVLHRDKKQNAITGVTTNKELLSLNLASFTTQNPVTIRLDSANVITVSRVGANDSVLLRKQSGQWSIAAAPSLRDKGPHRYGTFKDAFNYRMVFVFGTIGTKEENDWSYNKAIYDAESWYYRGNGAVDIIPDKSYDATTYKDRGIILFGNASTNAAWKTLLSDCPIQVDRNKITVGSKTWQGNDLCAYFVWPQKQSDFASVGVVTGTGLPGMKAANANQYFAGASGFPDFMVYSLGLLKNRSKDIKLAGFYSNDWKLAPDDSVTRE